MEENLGRVGYVDQGVYSDQVTYKKHDVVHTDEGVFVSLVDGNVGHPLVEGAYWTRWVNTHGINIATGNAERATARANSAAETAEETNLQSAQALEAANQAITQAQTLNTQSGQILSDCQQATEDSTTQTTACQEATAASVNQTGLCRAQTDATAALKEQMQTAITRAQSDVTALEGRVETASQKATNAVTTANQAHATAEQVHNDIANAVADAHSAMESASESAGSAAASASAATQAKNDAETAKNTAATYRNEVATQLSDTRQATNDTIAAKNQALAVKNEYEGTYGSRMTTIERDLAQYAESTSVRLSTGTAGKVVDNRGVAVNKSNYAISAPFRMSKGMMYLLRTPAAVDNGVALVAKKVTNNQTVAINYSYTYDAGGRIATATADYDTSKVYHYTYTGGGEGQAEVVTIEGPDGHVVEYLPQTRVATSGSYIPLFKALSSTLPKQGFYVVLCMEDCDAVVSAQASYVNGGEVIVTSYGIIRSIINNLSNEGHEHPQLNVVDEVTAHALATLNAKVEALERYIHDVTTGQVRVPAIAAYRYDLFGGEGNLLRMGHGAPTHVADIVGLPYVDLDAGKLYIAKSNTTASWEVQ